MALRRAAHQLVDAPLVFADPLALRILGLTADGVGTTATANDLRAPNRPGSKSLRAFLVARSQVAEDALHAAVRGGVCQYVLLGAGLDTFAYRNPYAHLTVFEADLPSAQQAKRALLQRVGMQEPSNARYVPLDLQQDPVMEHLQRAGLDPTQRAVFTWLGVVPYLHRAALETTLQELAGCAAGSVLLMDYSLPRSALPATEQLEFDSLAARVAAAGEPFQTWLEPQAAQDLLARYGWHVRQDLDRIALNERYFAGRDDGLAITRNGARVVLAELAAG